jgi:hypothetical protein
MAPVNLLSPLGEFAQSASRSTFAIYWSYRTGAELLAAGNGITEASGIKHQDTKKWRLFVFLVSWCLMPYP